MPQTSIHHQSTHNICFPGEITKIFIWILLLYVAIIKEQVDVLRNSLLICQGWSGVAMVLCILPHRGVQLILGYRWARSAILVAGKGRWGMFFFLLFLHFHSCSSFLPVPLSSLLLYLLSLFSLSLGDDTKWPTSVDVSLIPNSINQSLNMSISLIALEEVLCNTK